MSSGTTPVRVTARLVLGFAVLAGLFVMHGLMAGQGCPGGAGSTGSVTAEPSMAVHGPAIDKTSSVPQMPGSAPITDHAAAVAATVIDGPGALCVSSPPRQELAWLLALLLGVGVVTWAWPARLWNAGADRAGHGGRAPPLAGSRLLVRLCVSRT